MTQFSFPNKVQDHGAQSNFDYLSQLLGSDSILQLGSAAGGDLTGSYPNPTLGAGKAAANVGAIGGDLTGTLPNPTLAAATLQKFLQLVSAGTRKVNFGSGTFAFPASTVSNTVTVNHGLGVTPLAISVLPNFVTGGHVNAVSLTGGSVGSTSFSFVVRDVSGVATSDTITYYWIAVG